MLTFNRLLLCRTECSAIGLRRPSCACTHSPTDSLFHPREKHVQAAGSVTYISSLLWSVCLSSPSSVGYPGSGARACVGSLIDTESLLLGGHLITCQERFQAPYFLSQMASALRLCIVQGLQLTLSVTVALGHSNHSINALQLGTQILPGPRFQGVLFQMWGQHQNNPANFRGQKNF